MREFIYFFFLITNYHSLSYSKLPILGKNKIRAKIKFYQFFKKFLVWCIVLILEFVRENPENGKLCVFNIFTYFTILSRHFLFIKNVVKYVMLYAEKSNLSQTSSTPPHTHTHTQKKKKGCQHITVSQSMCLCNYQHRMCVFFFWQTLELFSPTRFFFKNESES